MRTRTVLSSVTFVAVLLTSPILAQTKPKPQTAKPMALKVPAGAQVVDGVVIPGCPTIPTQQDLVEPSVISADQSTHVLNTKLDTRWRQKVTVPAYSVNSGACKELTYNLRNYIDPTDGK